MLEEKPTEVNHLRSSFKLFNKSVGLSFAIIFHPENYGDVSGDYVLPSRPEAASSQFDA